MTNYKLMYLKLFNAVTDTISELQKVQSECEEMYISSEEPIDEVYSQKTK